MTKEDKRTLVKEGYKRKTNERNLIEIMENAKKVKEEGGRRRRRV